MKTEMTSRERIIASLHGKTVDHIPFAPFLAYLWESLPLAIQKKGRLSYLKDIGADALWRGTPCPVREKTAGVEIRLFTSNGKEWKEIITPVGSLFYGYTKSTEGNTVFLTDHPLKTTDDWKTQLWIEEHIDFLFCFDEINEHFQTDGQEGLSLGLMVPRMKTAFQSLVEIYCGTENLIYAMQDFPELVNEVWQVMFENNIRAATLAANSGRYDYFITWEDSSTTNYSPSLYCNYIDPEIRNYVQILGTRNKYYIHHACGHLRGLLPFVAESGITAVESLSPPPTGDISLVHARQILPGKCIIGGIEPTVLLRSDIDDLCVYVDQVLNDGCTGPFILANADSCPPGVTMEKLHLISQIANSWKP